MGAMKNLKIAQMELMEENAERIADACRLTDKGRACQKVVSLLKKCGFSPDPSNPYSLVRTKLEQIHKLFNEIDAAHKYGMKTSWTGKSFERVSKAVEDAEMFLNLNDFSTDHKYLSRLK